MKKKVLLLILAFFLISGCGDGKGYGTNTLVKFEKPEELKHLQINAFFGKGETGVYFFKDIEEILKRNDTNITISDNLAGINVDYVALGNYLYIKVRDSGQGIWSLSFEWKEELEKKIMVHSLRAEIYITDKERKDYLESVFVEGVINSFGIENKISINGSMFDINSSNLRVNNELTNISNLEQGMNISLSGDLNYYERGKSLFRFDIVTSDAYPTFVKPATADEAEKIIMTDAGIHGAVIKHNILGIADDLEYYDIIRGKINKINIENNSFFVMGQEVLLGEITNMNHLMLDDLIIGDFVRVSGFMQDSYIVSTFVEKIHDSVDETLGESYIISGYLSQLDKINLTFKINNLLVDYSLSTYDINDLMSGNMVHVIGSSYSLENEDNFKINALNIFPSKSSDGAQNLLIQGYKRDFVSTSGDNIIKLNNIPIDGGNIVKSYVFDGRFWNKSLVPKRWGYADNNVLIYDFFLYDKTSNYVVQQVVGQDKVEDTLLGVIEKIDIENYIIKVNGLDYYITPYTIYLDESLDDNKISIFDLNVGDNIEINIFEIGNNTNKNSLRILFGTDKVINSFFNPLVYGKDIEEINYWSFDLLVVSPTTILASDGNYYPIPAPYYDDLREEKDDIYTEEGFGVYSIKRNKIAIKIKKL
jgi:hypothetical protein